MSSHRSSTRNYFSLFSWIAEVGNPRIMDLAFSGFSFRHFSFRQSHIRVCKKSFRVDDILLLKREGFQSLQTASGPCLSCQGLDSPPALQHVRCHARASGPHPNRRVRRTHTFMWVECSPGHVKTRPDARHGLVKPEGSNPICPGGASYSLSCVW